MRWATVGGFTRNARRDCFRCQAAHLAERQRHLRVQRQRRMTTREDQPQPIVLDLVLAGGLGIQRARVEPFGELSERGSKARAAPHAVDRLEAAGGHEPRARVARHAVARPLLDRRRKGIVHRLFGEIEIAEQADQGCEHTPRVGAVDGIHHLPRTLASNRPRRSRYQRTGCQPLCCWLKSSIGRTSTLPSRADGIFEATWMASFRSLASIM